MMRVNSLHKSYSSGQESIEIFKGIGLGVKDDQIICVLGPSGSGRSTLLDILSGIETVSESEVDVFDNKLESISKKELEKCRQNYIGFVFQFHNLVSSLNVLENIEVGKYLSNNPVDIDGLIDDLGLKKHIYKFPSGISRGQAQRASIGRAIIKRPKSLICDEPTGALDYESTEDVLVLTERLNKPYGSTIMITTHNTQISKMCDMILSIRDGSIKSIEENKEKISANRVIW